MTHPITRDRHRCASELFCFRCSAGQWSCRTCFVSELQFVEVRVMISSTASTARSSSLSDAKPAIMLNLYFRRSAEKQRRVRQQTPSPGRWTGITLALSVLYVCNSMPIWHLLVFENGISAYLSNPRTGACSCYGTH